MMVVPVGMPATDRMEHAFTGRESQLFAREQLSQRRVIRDAHHLIRDLDLKMEIPDQPTHARRLTPIPQTTIRNAQFQHGFIFLGNYVNGALARKDRRSIHQRFLEIESKFTSIFRHAAPAPLGEGQTIDRQTNGRQV